tara:strand:- start:513 stop:872 length:360 start_codon:yes stop_codon:yes gene_type:complete
VVSLAYVIALSHADDLEVSALVVALISEIHFVSVPYQLLLALNHYLVVPIYVKSVPVVERLIKVIPFTVCGPALAVQDLPDLLSRQWLLRNIIVVAWYFVAWSDFLVLSVARLMLNYAV